jgi:thiol-disulfide isomerase/thioredoxin
MMLSSCISGNALVRYECIRNILIVLLAVVSIAHADTTPISEQYVINLTDANFDEITQGGGINSVNEAWILDFYAPWCGHCKTVRDESLMNN